MFKAVQGALKQGINKRNIQLYDLQIQSNRGIGAYGTKLLLFYNSL